MTINLFVTVVVLVCLGWALARARRLGRTLPPLALVLMLLVEAPLVLHPPYVPLSHILFEVTTPPVRVGSLALAGLLWVACLIQLRRFAGSSPDRRQLWTASAVLACAAFWVVLGATISHFESGPTPTVWDQPVWIAHLATLYLAAACQVVLIVRRKGRARVE